jgi:hypothetical protein
MARLILIIMIIHIILFTFISCSIASHWGAIVGTNTSSWHIYRQSQTMSFNFASSFDGSVSPVDYHGTIINPHYSSYKEIFDNDLRLSERTNAYEGELISDSNINLVSSDEEEINITIENTTDITTIEHNERWPARITTDGRLEYHGSRINSRNSWENNGDYLASNVLDSSELINQWTTISILERMNATVMATDEKIISAAFMPTKYLGTKMFIHAAGITDLSYKMTDSNYQVEDTQYPALTQGIERYYGSFNISKIMQIRSLFNESKDMDSWLPICSSGQEISCPLCSNLVR